MPGRPIRSLTGGPEAEGGGSQALAEVGGHGVDALLPADPAPVGERHADQVAARSRRQA
jgi:hypothetical protein